MIDSFFDHPILNAPHEQLRRHWELDESGQARIESVGDDADLKEVNDAERPLLCIASTLARDRLLVTSMESSSEFLGDMSRP